MSVTYYVVLDFLLFCATAVLGAFVIACII